MSREPAKRFNLTTTRLNLGILTPELEAKYNDLAAARGVIEEAKKLYGARWADVIKSQRKEIANTPVAKPRGRRKAA